MTSTEQEVSVQRYKMFIAGDWVDAASGETFERASPASGETVGIYPEATEADAQRAIEAARRAFDEGGWAESTAKQRHAILRGCADGIRANAEGFVSSIIREGGKVRTQAEAEVAAAADQFDYYAGKALDLKGEVISQEIPDAMGLVLKEPVGVVGIITPWNFPLILLSYKLPPALAAGCTAVAKPSHYTPGVTLMLAKVLQEAGLPDGVFNVVTSQANNGATIGEQMVTSPLVDKIAFTGSTAVGKRIMELGSRTVKRISLELGGKSPNIVFPDAQLDAAVAGAFTGVYRHSGQICVAGTRLFLAQQMKDEFIDRLSETARAAKIGDPNDSDTDIGPVISETQMERVMGYIDTGCREARLVLGGKRADDPALGKGYYVSPTIFDGVTNDMAIAQEEIFGPVLSILTFEDMDDLIRIANDTVYGLAAAVWTRDLNTALRVSKKLRAGTVWVNAYHGTGLLNMPFGGYKQSGIGREKGQPGLEGYLETKSVQINLS